MSLCEYVMQQSDIEYNVQCQLPLAVRDAFSSAYVWHEIDSAYLRKRPPKYREPHSPHPS